METVGLATATPPHQSTVRLVIRHLELEESPGGRPVLRRTGTPVGSANPSEDVPLHIVVAELQSLDIADFNYVLRVARDCHVPPGDVGVPVGADVLGHRYGRSGGADDLAYLGLQPAVGFQGLANRQPQRAEVVLITGVLNDLRQNSGQFLAILPPTEDPLQRPSSGPDGDIRQVVPRLCKDRRTVSAQRRRCVRGNLRRQRDFSRHLNRLPARRRIDAPVSLSISAAHD